MRLISRKREMDALQEQFNKGTFRFGYVYGQRRIGKTTLVEMFSEGKKHLSFYAIDTDEASLLKDFASSFAEQAGLPYPPSFPDWAAFFKAISAYFGDEKGVVSIDEFPLITYDRLGRRRKSSFSSTLQRAIDLSFRKQKFLLLLTGSSVSLVEREIQDSRAPLFGRADFTLPLGRFSLKEANEALADIKGTKERASVLLLTSTYPFYLSFIEPGKSVLENARSLFFEPQSPFLLYPESLITSDILSGGFFTSILRGIAEGKEEYETLRKSLAMESADLSKHIRSLEELGVIRKRYRFHSRRGVRLEIEDPILAFYFRFIKPYAERIRLGEGEAIFQSERNAIEGFLHRRFEFLAMDYLEALNREGRLGAYYPEFSHYVREGSELGRSIELDCCAGKGDHLLVAECKFSSKKRGYQDYLDMLEDVSVPPFRDYREKEFYLFGASGFDRMLFEPAEENLHLVGLEEMLGERDPR